MNAALRLVTASAAVGILLTACSVRQPARATSQETARLRLLEAQVAGLQDILQNTAAEVRVDPEPVGDVSGGLFIARIDRVTTSGPTPSIVLDFVTPGSVPGTDSHVRNECAHPQTLPVGQIVPGMQATLILRSSRGFEIVPPNEFARRFQAESGADMDYYVEVTGGEIVRVWPVAEP